MRLFVNQIGITFFALVLTMAVSRMENDSFKLWVSVFSILFYLCLIYSVMWEAGAANAVPIEAGRMERDRLFSLKASLFASVPNLALALLMLVFFLLGYVASIHWAGGVYAVLHIVTGLFEAMHAGVFSAILKGLSGVKEQLVACILYLLSSLPMILVSMGAYALGMRNIRLLGKASAPKGKK
jgi:hypothetical protein